MAGKEKQEKQSAAAAAPKQAAKAAEGKQAEEAKKPRVVQPDGDAPKTEKAAKPAEKDRIVDSAAASDGSEVKQEKQAEATANVAAATQKKDEPKKDLATNLAPKDAAPPREKEKNFVSAVIYLGDEAGAAKPFLTTLCGHLAARFANYELVFVEDASRDGTEAEVRAFLNSLQSPPPVTMIHLSLKQGLELAMNAGLDMAVGDFVYEFDSMRMPYPPEMIDQAYDSCIAGSDIVTVSPSKNRSLGASLFYKLFNTFSKSRYQLRTDVFRLLSRRAINRVHSISASMPYRKAAYAASGLKLESLCFTGKPGALKEKLRFTRALDSLALYTTVASKVSLLIAGVMLLLMLVSLIYTLVVFFGGLVQPAPGWTTTMLLLTGGFFGVFLILAFVLEYLSLLVEMVFHKQSYLVESVEKLS